MQDSDNPLGADNQQETELAEIDPWWVVGFVDGEGCFSVSIHRNELAKPTNGWHIQPTFHVAQHIDHVDVLYELRRFFGCGSVRRKSASNPVMVYSVHSTKQLLERVIPFFETHPLRVKRDDFERFRRIAAAVRQRRHHRPEVFRQVVEVAYAMNRNGRQRKRPIEEILSGSSETARQAPSGSTVKVQSDPRGDTRSQAEMSDPQVSLTWE
jgi:hypothetical protein